MLIEILRDGLLELRNAPKAWWLPPGAEEAPEEREPIGLSEMLACIRRLWFKYNQEPPTDADPADMVAVWQIGSFMERLIIAALEAGGAPVDDAQTSMRYRGILGHNDGILHTNRSPRLESRLGPNRSFMLELKSGKPNKVRALQRRGVRDVYPEYYMQVQMYLAAYKETFGRELDGAYFLIGNKAPDFKQGLSVDSWYEELITPELEVAEYQMDYVLPKIKDPVAPPIPYEKPAPLCYHCNFFTKCWGATEYERRGSKS